MSNLTEQQRLEYLAYLIREGHYTDFFRTVESPNGPVTINIPQWAIDAVPLQPVARP